MADRNGSAAKDKANAVRSYFEDKAGKYQEQSGGIWWRWLRERESAAVMELTGAVGGSDVLELGCGTGYYARQLLARGARHVYCVDISESMVSRLPRKGITGIVADAANIELDKSFLSFVSAGLLEFVDDPSAVLSNARGMAGEDANFVILVPRLNLWGRFYRAFHRRHGIRVRLFSSDDIAKLAGGAGWQVVKAIDIWPFCLVTLLELKK